MHWCVQITCSDVSSNSIKCHHINIRIQVQSLGRLLGHRLNNISVLLHTILEFDLALRFNSDLKLQR